MSQQINNVLYRVPSGEPVGIPKRHLAVFGVTRDSGKTTFIESAVATSGMRAIVFRTKRGEIGFENAKPLPLFFDERGLTHWKALEGLVAATLEEKVQREPGVRGAIIDVCKNPFPAKSLSEIHQRVKEKLEDPKIRGFTKDVFTKLDAYLEEVLPQLEKLRDRFSNRIELPEPGVYVEDLEGLGVKTDELQNLFVASLIKKAYEELSGVIIVVAEIWKFLPQDRGSPVKWVIEKYVREMGVVEGWLWLDAQDLRGVDKKHLRSFDVRLFGRQPDAHEIDEILRALPLPKQQKPKPEQIMTLKLGHFYAKLRNRVELVYVRPLWLPESVAIKVARGELEPDSEEVQHYKPSVEVEDEEMWREKYELLEKQFADIRTRIYEEVKEEFDKRAESLKKLGRQELEEEFRNYKDTIQSLSETIKNFENENKKLHEELADADARIQKLYHTDEEVKAVQDLKEALKHLLPTPTIQGSPVGFEPTTPSEISIATEQPSITVKVERKPLALTDKDLDGKVAILYASGELPADDWFTVTNVFKVFRSHGWSKDPRTSKTLDSFCQWGYLEKRYSGKRPEYRLRLKPREAKEKGLLRVEE